MSRKWWRQERYFAPSRPRKAEGGIKAQLKRGGFGESWWARLDPGTGKFRYRRSARARPVLCAQWASVVDRD